ncbi:hypothetical protein RJ639_037389 [Escallonia herrerae]|uniref:Transposase (putative) gypsy type domain-containing protein n=1 Tax=Escallonia herrerae TaxID=1293975 RepID=A0AA88WPC6_9ASTE|nr:hypothetical protein RJ639_037389 [Escallonia herrerae]
MGFCSDRILLIRDSVRTEFCSAVVTLLGQSVRTKFCSDIILLSRCHFARAECSDGILFGQNYSQTGFCSDKILLCRCYSARAECSDGILFGQNSARPLSLCSGRVFGRDSVRPKFCSALVTLLGQSVRMRFCSGRILLGHCHSAQAECSDMILLGQNSFRQLPLCSGRVFRRDSARAKSWFPPRVSFSVDVFEPELKKFKFLYSSACDTCGVDEPLRFPRNGYLGFLYKKRTFTSFFLHSKFLEAHYSSRSEVGTSNPQLPLPSTSHPFQPSTSQPLPLSSSQPSHSLSRKNALGDVKDQADEKVDPKPWYTADEKSGKMSTEDLQNLIREYLLPEGWYARLPGLQEPANYGTKFETGVYKEHVKSGYRLPLHPFALRFFEHYRMAPGQLVPNGWRKLADLIYLVQTLGYKPDATDFTRVFFEIYFVKGVANCPGWTRITPPERSPRILEQVSLDDDPIFRPRWTLKRDDLGRSSRLRHTRPLPAPLPRPSIRLERVKRKAAEEVTKARDQGIRDFLDGNAGDEWLKKRTDDGLEIYDLGFAKANEMFAERFPDIPLGDFVLPAIVSPSGETVMPSEPGDAAASHLPGEGPSGDAPEP